MKQSVLHKIFRSIVLEGLAPSANFPIVRKLRGGDTELTTKLARQKKIQTKNDTRGIYM